MGLNSSLLIGQSALTASQLALQITGNNLANIGTPGFHRQSAALSPIRGSEVLNGQFAGGGVLVSDIRRAINPALQARLRAGISDENAASAQQSVLLQLESLTNELTGIDLSSELDKFFNSFSDLANNPGAPVTHAAVIEQGATLAGYMRSLRSDLINQRTQIDDQIRQNVNRADELLGDIAELNVAIVNAENGVNTEGNLRDQRDVLIDELSGLMDVTVVEKESGAVDILVGSQPVVLGDTSRGLELRTESEDGEIVVNVLISEEQEKVSIEGGTIGGLLDQRKGAIERTIEELDGVAANLIYEVNRIHSSGRPVAGLTDVTGTLQVLGPDQSLALNDPANASLSELPFAPRNGSFEVVIRDQNGNETVTTIQVDLDGIDNTGAAGFGDDTSLASLTSDLDAIGNLNAQITSSGQLRLTTAAGYEVSFRDDTSGALATLGVNTYFQGTDAKDIAVRQALRDDPGNLVVAPAGGSNEAALAIAGLRDAKLDSLGGISINELWLRSVEKTAVQTATANTRQQALQTVRQSLEAQNAAISGVSADEESINLITYQQQYQGAARFVSVVGELTDLLFTLV